MADKTVSSIKYPNRNFNNNTQHKHQYMFNSVKKNKLKS